MRMICTRQARATAFRRASSIGFLLMGNGIDAYVADRDLRGIHDLVRRPDDRAFDILGDADDVVEERGDVVVDADRVRLDGLRDPTAANHIGIRGDRTGEITRARSVDRIRVPDAPDVEAVP